MSPQKAQRLPNSDAAVEVQRFYERYPYPRPVENLDDYRLLWQDRPRRRADYHLFWPTRPFREAFCILVAGCGTSQAAKYALRWPAAQVTGIDFSATSVRCTETLKRKYKLDNLQVRQLSVERAGELETTFDQIICTGVLHHLSDPDAGLSALRSVLEPEGAMHLMVYAPYGRTGIYMLQEFCRRIGIRAAEDEIRDLVAALKALPPGHPLEKLLREAPDFQHEAALADALLHPQDRAYSVPQFFDFIERAGLTFGRWLRQAPYSARCGVLAKLPQTRRISSLSPSEQYAAAELFRGTMVRHSAVVYRNDNPQAQHVSFEGDGWLDYVPARASDTVCVQERLPDGAAAVLINRSHTFRDLYLPIDTTEKSLFDGVDGNRSIGEIVEDRFPAPCSESILDRSRGFFERLWWYDQVVFDISKRATGHLSSRRIGISGALA
jgi:SAM-dependent methyltransferase